MRALTVLISCSIVAGCSSADPAATPAPVLMGGALPPAEDAAVPPEAPTPNPTAADAAPPATKGRRSAGCGGTAPAGSGQLVAGNVTASAKTRTFHVTTPEVYDATKAHALVLVLHGAGDTSPETMNEWFVAPDYPSAIYVYPQALPRTRKDGSGGNIPRWDLDGSEDLAFYDALVDRLEGAYCVDTARVFAAGFSSGGNFAQQLGCLRSASLRGFAAVAGPGPFTTKCGGAIAAWMTHDVDDKALSVEGARDSRDFWAGHDACGAKWSPSAKLPPACTTNTGCAAATPLVYCETKGIGHEVPPFASKAIGEFFASLD